MDQEDLFKELVIVSLICGNYLGRLEKDHPRKSAENVDIGTTERRRQMIDKYSEGKEVTVSMRRYKKLVEKFAKWSDEYSVLTDVEKKTKGEENLFFEKT